MTGATLCVGQYFEFELGRKAFHENRSRLEMMQEQISHLPMVLRSIGGSIVAVLLLHCRVLLQLVQLSLFMSE